MSRKAFARSAVGGTLAAALAACGGGGGDSSPPVVLNPPVISAQPTAQSVLTDASATFSVTATGAGLSYQWRRNGTAIAGATSASYTTPAASYADQGAQYSVTVTNADGSVTSSAAALSLVASASQQAFESVALAPSDGSYLFRWNLNLSGPQASGTNYAYSESSVLAQSPLTAGPQTNAQSAPANLATSLALTSTGPTRILKNGSILVVPTLQASNRISYVGSDVRVDSLAADNTTVAYSQLRSDYTSASLTGLVSATPAEFAQWFNSFFANPAVLTAGATYQAGAGYIKYTSASLGDRYTAFDCVGATTDANITPCASATTLNAALTAGIVSNSDVTTYHLADGTLGTVGGVPVWVATAPRPLSATLSSTVQYRIYFQLNGNVYTGSLIRDGAVLGGSYYVSNPGGATVEERLTLLPYQIRMNKAARDSLAAAMAI